MPAAFGSAHPSVCHPSRMPYRCVGPAPEYAVTVAGFESQKRNVPSGPCSSWKAGGCRAYPAKRLAASPKRASDVESRFRRRTT